MEAARKAQKEREEREEARVAERRRTTTDKILNQRKLAKENRDDVMEHMDERDRRKFKKKEEHRQKELQVKFENRNRYLPLY